MSFRISPKLFVTAVFLVTVTASAQVFAQSGSFDTGFGEGGTFTLDADGMADVRSHAVQSDGKVVILSQGPIDSIYKNRLTRIHADGTLDTTFDGDGVLDFYWANPTFTTARAMSVVIQSIQTEAGPEDRIVVAGLGVMVSGRKPSTALRISRFLPDGSADPSFGTNGNYFRSGVGISLKVIVRPSDQALLNYTDLPPTASIVCVSANGEGPCPAFGTSGMFSVKGAPGGGRGLAFDSSERVLVLSRLSTGKGKSARTGPAVTRYTPAGQIDPSFGTNGTTLFDYNSTATAYSLAIDTFGNVVVGGGHLPGTSSDNDLIAYRLTSSGALDTNFGSGGRAIYDFAGGSDLVGGIAVQSNGQILLSGQAQLIPGVAGTDFIVLRFNYDGTLDATFGSGGSVTWNIGTVDFLQNITVENVDGSERILVSGTSYPFVVSARLLP